MRSEAPAILEARDLAFGRDDEPLFSAISFALGPGEVLVVLGDNGSGKTTLLRVLAGLIEPTAGQLLHYGRPIETDPQAWFGELALIGHLLGLKLDLSARQHLRWCADTYGLRRGQSVDAALRSVGLTGYEDLPARQLSAGQRKRAALARLLLCPARCWLLDEPYANLDPQGIALVNRLIERHSEDGGIVVLTSHGIYPPPTRRHQTRRLSA